MQTDTCWRTDMNAKCPNGFSALATEHGCCVSNDKKVPAMYKEFPCLGWGCSGKKKATTGVNKQVAKASPCVGCNSKANA